MRQSRALPPEQLTRHVIDSRDLEALTGVCRICGPVALKRRSSAWACENSARRARAEHLLTRYGMREEDYWKLYDEQLGCCAICGRFKELLHVDHNHMSGSNRGLLCGDCNRGIGLFRENPDTLMAAVAYLLGWSDAAS